ncbi:MAG: S41 family peptidase [Chloroflexota bacterium]
MKQVLRLGGVFLILFLAACGSQSTEQEEISEEIVVSTAAVESAIPNPTPTAVPIPEAIELPQMKQGDLEPIPSAELLADAAILYEALDTLHPGLFRHIDQGTFNLAYTDLEAMFATDLTLPQAYLAISQFLGAIQDGHTYANFYNQNSRVINQVFAGADKLPFYFRIIDGRMIVTESAIEIEEGILDRGTEIRTINGTPVEAILTSLLPYVKADGGNDLKRYYDLQVSGIPQYEWFDIFYPLLFPSTAEEFIFEIDAAAPDGTEFSFETAGVKSGWRAKQIENRYTTPLASPNELWAFNIISDDVAVLRMRTFAVWNSALDWETFLEDAFRQLESSSTPNLIIDIRGNEGGLDIIPATIDTYISQQPLEESFPNAYVAYETVPESLDPYLNSWDSNLKDLTGEVEPIDNRLYGFVENDRTRYTSAFGNNPLLYDGSVYLLMDSGNSSATFLWGQSWRKSEVGTLVGQETGGNLRGTTGGWFFQLELPNSGIEVDIPLIASFPAEPLRNVPDEGLVPDIIIAASIDGIKSGNDTQIEELIQIISRQ